MPLGCGVLKKAPRLCGISMLLSPLSALVAVLVDSWADAWIGPRANDAAIAAAASKRLLDMIFILSHNDIKRSGVDALTRSPHRLRFRLFPTARVCDGQRQENPGSCVRLQSVYKNIIKLLFKCQGFFGPSQEMSGLVKSASLMIK